MIFLGLLSNYVCLVNVADVEIGESDLWSVDVELQVIAVSPSGTDGLVEINQQSGEAIHMLVNSQSYLSRGLDWGWSPGHPLNAMPKRAVSC